MRNRPVYYLRGKRENIRAMYSLVYMTWRERLVDDPVVCSMLDGAIVMNIPEHVGGEIEWSKWNG